MANRNIVGDEMGKAKNENASRRTYPNKLVQPTLLLEQVYRLQKDNAFQSSKRRIRTIKHLAMGIHTRHRKHPWCMGFTQPHAFTFLRLLKTQETNMDTREVKTHLEQSLFSIYNSNSLPGPDTGGP